MQLDLYNYGKMTMAVSHYSIMILEDSPEDRLVYSRYLRQDCRTAYDVVEAESGADALTQLTKNKPDLILLNYQLPDMDGLEFLNKLKLQFGSAEIPVIILAEKGDEAIAVQAMKSGVQDYIVKSKLTCAGLCRAVYTVLEKTSLMKQIRIQEQQQQLLAEISLRIRQCLCLEEILQIAVQEIRKLFQVDRVIVYQFDSQMNGTVVAESVLSQWKPLLRSQIEDTCFQEISGKAYREGKVRAISDIYNAELTAYHIDLLEQSQVKANLVVPILLNTEAAAQEATTHSLWGLLIVHQCSSSRKWETNELELLQQLSVQMAVAIQQAQLYENLQTLNNSLEQKVEERTARLQDSERRYQEAMEAIKVSEAELRGLFNAMVDVIMVVNKKGRYLKIAPTNTDKLYRPAQELLGKTAHEILPTHLADKFVRVIEQTLATQQPSECEYSLQIKNQEVWFSAKISPISQETVIWAARDITKAKRNEIIQQQAELAFQESQILLQIVMDSLPMAIFWKDRNSRYLGCNRQLVLDAGVSSAAEIIGKTDFDMPWREQAPLYQAGDRLVIESGQPKYNMEEPFTKSGNICRWLYTNKIPLRTPNGEIFGVLASYEDITERKLIEHERDRLLEVLEAQNQTLEAQVTQRTTALQQSEKRFRSLVETSSDWIWEVDESVVYTYVSPQITTVLGYSPAEILGKTPYDLMPPAEARRVAKEIRKFASIQAPFQCLENTNQHKDGSLIILETSAVPIFDADGKFRGYRGMDRNITARKQAENTVRQNEIRFQRIAANVPGAMYQHLRHPDGTHEFVYFSDRCREIFELEAATIQQDADRIFNLVHTDDLASLQLSIDHSAHYLQQWSWEGRIITASGSLKWIKGISQPELQANGDILWDGLILDISDQQAALHERQQIEAEIIRSRDLREAIFNESTDALFLVDAETVKTIDCNQRAVEMFTANNKTELIGIEGHNLQKHQFTPEEIQAIADEMDKQGFWCREIEYRTFRGELFWGNLAAKQINVADQLMNLVRVTDISERKQAEAQLQETNKQLAAFNNELSRATRLKDEFLANMSHELRTPLNSILGLSEALQEGVFGVINDKQKRSLQTIERSGSHLLELINDILDLSKVEAEQMELHQTPVVISTLCQSSLSFIKQQALQKSIQIEVKIQPYLPNLLLDERRIRQVLINLLNNAMKFTPEGGRITLEVTRQQLTPEGEITSLQNIIRFAVIDTGIGIAPENIDKLFKPFIQIDSALNRQYAGTGLGLSLVKRLVEIHGGRVGVSSEFGVGSCFTVDLPCGDHVSAFSPGLVNQQAPSDFDPIFNETAQKSPLILLAEDNEANIFTISNYLEAIGYRIIFAKSGREAIALTHVAEAPDLILMDIQMPEIDGLEAIKLIRAEPKSVHIPIIALTALAMPGDREKCLAAGANDYLTKPVKLKQLVTIIKQFLAAKNINS
jgi:PAS domain S-box-containing protein